MIESLCQTCFCFRCPWHIAFEPTPGWTATPTTIKNANSDYKSYCVTQCPLYKQRDWDPVTVSQLANMIGCKSGSVRRMEITGTLRNNLLERGYMLKVDKSEKKYKYFIRRIKNGKQ